MGYPGAMTPQEVAQALRGAAERLPDLLREAEAATLQDALEEAHKLSHGHYSTRQLAAMGHPYSAAHPAPPQDEAIINYQRGDFDRGWQVEEVQESAGGDDALAGRLYNDSENADRLDKGTSLMIARPIIDRIAERIAPRRAIRAQEAYERAMKGT